MLSPHVHHALDLQDKIHQNIRFHVSLVILQQSGFVFQKLAPADLPFVIAAHSRRLLMEQLQFDRAAKPVTKVFQHL